MTIPPATPDLPAVDISHGVGALVLVLRDDHSRSLGTVLSPDAARDLARQLRQQASEAERLMRAYHPPPEPDEPTLPHLIVLAVLVALIAGGILVGAVIAWR